MLHFPTILIIIAVSYELEILFTTKYLPSGTLYSVFRIYLPDSPSRGPNGEGCSCAIGEAFKRHFYCFVGEHVIELWFSVFNFQPLILGWSQNISLFSLGLWVGISFFYMVSERRILIISQYAVLAIR